MKSGKAVRHPMIIAGAIREALDYLVQFSGRGGPGRDFVRLQSLAAELEEALTLDMLTNSARLLARQKGE
jgi:hypothetical protein